MKKKTKSLEKTIIALIFAIMIAIGLFSDFEIEDQTNNINNVTTDSKVSYEISNIPQYLGETYIEINNNIPQFTEEDLAIEEDYYSDLEDGKARNGNDKNQLGKGKFR